MESVGPVILKLRGAQTCSLNRFIASGPRGLLGAGTLVDRALRFFANCTDDSTFVPLYLRRQFENG